jgi:bifunctional non-homologous end joining protein LigD
MTTARTSQRDTIPHQAPATPLPDAPEPMLCTLAAEPFDNPDWLFEPKYDGLRVLARFDGDELTLLSRNNKPQNFQFPDVADALRAGLDRPALLDGEVVCFDKRGRSSFRALQQRFHLKNAAAVQERLRAHPAFIYVFDILHLDGRDLTGLPLEERKRLLKQSVHWSDKVRYTDFHSSDGKKLLNEACRAEEEGIIAKHRRSRYEAGRSGSWVKVKCVGRQEFVIGGFTDPQRSRVGLGALLVGYYKGGQLRYAGKVGTGYTRETLLDLRHRLDKIERDGSPFDVEGPQPGEPAYWVEPRLVAVIGFVEWTQNDLLRQPRFKGLREDKKPEEVRRERPTTQPTDRHAKGSTETGGDAVPLEEYKVKRDFTRTDEPGPKVGKRHKQPIFVIQEHHASHLHYDFRLEADGVLKSWAVPKEPTLDPAQKRLAVRVEDHPVAYAGFSGTIPAGQYGAGEVSIWDHGTYDNLLADKATPQTVTEGITAGRVEFALHGTKLNGRFALIRMQGRKSGGKENWLLIKMKDEFAAPGSADAPRHKPAARAKPARAKAKASSTKAKPAGGVEITHPEKVLYPEPRFTKEDVADYYRRIAPRLLPHLRDRPITLERLPDGLAGKTRFWQKDVPNAPDWVPRVELPTEDGKTVHYALVNDVDTLLYFVNQGTLTFHVWFSRVEDLDRPDFVLFDLDPGQAAFSDVIAVAKQVHEELTEEGEKPVVKTSGKTGLHILVPWRRDGGYDEARGWAEEVAAKVVGALPEQATTERSKAKRGKRVYVDVMQNARGRHAVPPYVLRATPGAMVSTPLAWREVKEGLDPARFTLKTIFRRLARQGRDPLAVLLPRGAAVAR